MRIGLRLFLARFFWMRGKPPRNGDFLLQHANGDVKFEWWMHGSPHAQNSDVVYWKRANAPLPPPKEYLSYSAKRRLTEGENVPFTRPYY